MTKERLRYFHADKIAHCSFTCDKNNETDRQQISGCNMSPCLYIDIRSVCVSDTIFLRSQATNLGK